MATKGANYKMLLDVLKEAKDMAKFQFDFIKNQLEDDGFSIDRLGVYLESDSLNEENILKIRDELKRSIKEDNDKFAEVWHDVTTDAIEDGLNLHCATEKAENPEITDEEVMMKMISSAIDDAAEAYAGLTSVANIEKESDKEIKAYIDYMASPEYEEKISEQLKEWKLAAEEEEDSLKKRKLEKQIYVVENRYTLSFLYERIKNEKTHDKEIKSIIESFFDTTKSRYVMERFFDKCEQCGVDRAIYRSFFNIEECFLDEKYHVFNNLFLFMAMRYIGHIDVHTEITELKYVINCMTNLIYHRFVSDEVKGLFLDGVYAFLDEFEFAREKFEQENILHPKHPERIRKDKEREEKSRETIRKNLISGGFFETEEEARVTLDPLSYQDLISYVHNLQTAENEKHDIYEAFIVEELVDAITPEMKRMNKEDLENLLNEYRAKHAEASAEEVSEDNGEPVEEINDEEEAEVES